MEKTLDKIVALSKSRGFVYPGSEIYGGLANTWDYGNLGVELKNNVKRAWWQKFIMENIVPDLEYNEPLFNDMFRYELNELVAETSQYKDTYIYDLKSREVLNK